MGSQGPNNVLSLADHRAKLAALTAAEAKLIEEERRLSPEGQADAIKEIRADIGQIRDAISTVAQHITDQADAQAEADAQAKAQAQAAAQTYAQARAEAQARARAQAQATPAPVAKPKQMPWPLQLALVLGGAYIIVRCIEGIRESRSAAEAIRYSNLIEMERAAAYAAGAAEAWEMANAQRVAEVQPIVEQAARSWLSQNRNDLKGERGEQGIQGIRGERGTKGARGERGLRGAPGRSIRGPKGERGEQGRQGARGQRGATGNSVHRHTHSLDMGSMVRFGAALGQAAARGPRGEQGAAGRDGRDGKVVVRKMPTKKVDYWG